MKQAWGKRRREGGCAARLRWVGVLEVVWSVVVWWQSGRYRFVQSSLYLAVSEWLALVHQPQTYL